MTRQADLSKAAPEWPGDPVRNGQTVPTAPDYEHGFDDMNLPRWSDYVAARTAALGRLSWIPPVARPCPERPAVDGSVRPPER